MPPVPFSLAEDLAAQVATELRRGTRAEVRFDAGSRAIYASDHSHYRQAPVGVVIPRSVEDVIATVAICNRHGIPILGRGTGTSLAGQTCNAAVVIDFSKYLNRLLKLDARKHYAWVEPGLINDQLRDAAEEYALTFAPDPATHAYCTLGGMIGNNSCGAHSVLGGKTSENIEELDILTYDGLRMRVGATGERELRDIIRAGGRRGEIYAALKTLRDTYADEIRERYPNIPRRVSGYNLDYLLPENGFHVARALVGTESTCALVLAAKTRLIRSPQCRVLLVISYPDVFSAGDMAAPMAELRPIAIEGFERTVIENTRKQGKHLPGLEYFDKGDAWLLVEFGADSHADAMRQAKKAQSWLEKHDRKQLSHQLVEDPQGQKNAMRVREAGLGASRVPSEDFITWDGWEDAAVPPARLGDYLRDFYALMYRYNYQSVLYGHFGQGCVHCRISFELRTEEGVATYRKFVTEAAHLVTHYGGSLSGEHGDGQSRAEFLPIMFGERLVGAFREFKRIWDPGAKMNPGKVVDPYPCDTNLRIGPDYKPTPVLTIFQFPEDDGSLSHATERCFGIGKCRQLEGGTMCPSFQATREEQHSTRGRARMLFELLRGDVMETSWQNEHVKEALDLCLACKGCKGDCPVSVDVATYKAEFLAHYYESTPRPMAAHAMGQIHRWAGIASRFPDVANAMTQTPGISAAAKKLAGIAPQRKMPAFPPETFRDWFFRRERGRSRIMPREVILWADTFNNHFFPHTAKAAVTVLEDAGFHVRVPRKRLCCGRPLYDWGLLEQAKDFLRDIMTNMAEDIAAGTPIVCLEPSCAAVFRDELVNLFPKEAEAHKLKNQVVLLADFLDKDGYKPPKLDANAIVHGHCHQKALWGMSADQRLLERMGVEAELLDSGCCGLAGSFGYETDHYDISMKIGNRVLLPKVRSAARETIVISDGFSCRQQIAHGTRRKGMHLAEVIAMALKQDGAAVPLPERKNTEPEPGFPTAAIVAGVAAAGTLGLWLARRIRKKD